MLEKPGLIPQVFTSKNPFHIILGGIIIIYGGYLFGSKPYELFH